MVSTAVIKRMFETVEALEERLKPSRAVVFISCKTFLDQEAVFARHEQLYPDDKNPSLHVCTVTSGGSFTPHLANPWDEKHNAAWRALAREEMGRLSNPELTRLWVSRAIKSLQDKSWDSRHVAAEVNSTVREFNLSQSEADAVMRSANLSAKQEADAVHA